MNLTKKILLKIISELNFAEQHILGGVKGLQKWAFLTIFFCQIQFKKLFIFQFSTKFNSKIYSYSSFSAKFNSINYSINSFLMKFNSKNYSFNSFSIKFNSKNYSFNSFLTKFNSKNYSFNSFSTKFNSKIYSKSRNWLYSIQWNIHSIRKQGYRTGLLSAGQSQEDLQSTSSCLQKHHMVTILCSLNCRRLRPVALSYVNTIPSAAQSLKKTEFAKIETSLPTFSHISTLQPTIQQPFKHSFGFVTAINVESLVNLWNQSTLCEYNGMRTRVVHKSIK